MPLYIAKSGDLDRCYRCLTHSQTKDSATQLLTKYKSGALVTQFWTPSPCSKYVKRNDNFLTSLLLKSVEFLWWWWWWLWWWWVREGRYLVICVGPSWRYRPWARSLTLWEEAAVPPRAPRALVQRSQILNTGRTYRLCPPVIVHLYLREEYAGFSTTSQPQLSMNLYRLFVYFKQRLCSSVNLRK